MVEQIDELGIANKKLGQVISRSPQLLLRKPKEFLKVGNSVVYSTFHVNEERIEKANPAFQVLLVVNIS